MQSVALLTFLLVNSCAGFYERADPKTVNDNIFRSVIEAMMKCTLKTRENHAIPKAQELYGFWSKQFNIDEIHPFLGCIVSCGLHVLEWLDAKEQWIEENLRAHYFENFGPDINTMDTLTDLFQKCYNTTTDAAMSCEPGVEFLKCYRKEMFYLGWVHDED